VLPLKIAGRRMRFEEPQKYPKLRFVNEIVITYKLSK
jgi:hypothetical protein